MLDCRLGAVQANSRHERFKTLRSASAFVRVARQPRKRFVVRADGKLTAFVELESAIRRAIAATIGQAHASGQQRIL